jgi:transposase
MIGLNGTVRVLVATNPIDFRRVLTAWPRSCATSWSTDRAKLVFWDGNGVVPVAKRLEGGEFRWPKVQNGVIHLSAAEPSALLEGLDWRRVHAPRPTSVPVERTEAVGASTSSKSYQS